MPVTLKDIAEKAGVSKPVVSAVLNNRSRNSRVSEATRKRVLDLANKLHYIPNSAAQTLTNRETKSVTVVIPSFRFFQVWINSVLVTTLQFYLSERGYKLQVTSLDQGFREGRLISSIDTDGIVFFFWGSKQQLVEEMEKLGVPIVVANARFRWKNASNVYRDERATMYDLTKKVITAGHRRIVHVGTFMLDTTHQEGLKGIEQAVKETEGVTFKSIPIPIDSEAYAAAVHEFNLGKPGLEAALADPIKPTVVMFNGDEEAISAVRAAHDMGLKAPDDISITGAGNSKNGAWCIPSITTTEDVSKDMGEAIGEMILDNIVNKKNDIRKIGIAGKGIVRESLKVIK